MIKAVAGLIKCGDKYLLARRTTGDKEAVDKWEFPGGKIESNETDIDALIRESKEELNINIEVIKYLCEYTQVYPTRTIYLKLYLCVNKSEVININEEHSEYVIVDFEDIANYDLAPADKKMYEMLTKNNL